MPLILNSVFPIFAIIAAGAFLKQRQFIDDNFVSTSDRLIYYIFFPALLFRKIGSPAATSMEWNMIVAVWCTVFAVFMLSLFFARLVKMPNVEVGSFSQACYRFSTYVGMAVVMTDMGEHGAREFGVLVGFLIPFINILAISSLIRYGNDGSSRHGAGKLMLKACITNPLIIACTLGMLYSRLNTPLPASIDNCLSLVSLAALPLALLSIGGSLTFLSFGKHFRSSTIAAIFKLILMPMLGYCLLHAFGVQGPGFKVAMIYFALPTSPNNYILSAQLNSDLELAASSVVVSTLLSMAALSVTLVFFNG